VSAVRGAATSVGGPVAGDVTPGNAGAAAAASSQSNVVISAKVQQVLADNLVQVAIGNLLLELASDIPLQAGQTVRIAVSQGDQGVRLAIIGAGAASDDPASATMVNVTAPLLPVIAPASDRLTGIERLAVSIASEDAATQQGGQAALFADLNAVADAPNLPPALRAAIAQVLAQQIPLDTDLTGEDIRKAFQGSGLLLEASLANNAFAPAAEPTGNTPDLKAALIVLRQALTTLLQSAGSSTPMTGSAAGPTSYAPASAATPQPAQLAAGLAAPAAGLAAPAAGFASSAAGFASPMASSPPLAPEIDAEAMPTPASNSTSATATQQRMPSAQALNGLLPADGELVNTLTTAVALPGALLQARSQSLTPSAVLTLLQEAQQQVPRAAGFTQRGPLPGLNQGDVVIRTSTPPPPFRGSLPTAQAIASPSLAPETPLPAIAQRLLEETDAALSRHTLLQVASLPDRADASGARVDPTAPRWNFEIPFLTPQGTAMAQFEISRDGGGSEQERDQARKVWRARFSLDVEPAGPVHALVTYNSERTSVRMWAERPGTAAQLRAGVNDLSQALSKAELSPGDIVVQLGTPPAAAPPKAGHFLDRAL
jgi:hypothetical protein